MAEPKDDNEIYEELKTQEPKLVDSFPAPANAVCDHWSCSKPAELDLSLSYVVPRVGGGTETIIASRYSCLDHAKTAAEPHEAIDSCEYVICQDPNCSVSLVEHYVFQCPGDDQ